MSGAREYWLKQAAKAEAALADGRPWLLGETFSVADIMLGSCLGWAGRRDVAVPRRSSGTTTPASTPAPAAGAPRKPMKAGWIR